MNALVSVDVTTGEIVEFKPQEALERDAKVDAIIDLAKRTTNWPLLEQAVDTKLDDQEDFVNWWRENVSVNHGAGRGKKNADPGSFSVDAAADATGISQQQVSKWGKRLQKRDEYRSALYGVAYRKAMGETLDNHRAVGTGENEWYTPSKYIELARKVMGGIDLDPASSDTAQATVKAKRFFSLSDNGLTQEWIGRVWLNPPYAQPAVQKFIQKLADEVLSDHVDQAVLLTHNYTDTEWFHIAARACNAICFTRGRIKFESPSGEIAAPTQGQAFCYFGENVSEFTEQFGEIGFIMVRA